MWCLCGLWSLEFLPFRRDLYTTVDYILVDADAMSHCCTHSEDDLNTSDHLPITVGLLLYDSCAQFSEVRGPESVARIDWDLARKTNDLSALHQKFRLDFPHSCTPHMRMLTVQELRHVCWLLVDAAEKTLPHVQPRRKRKWWDDALSCLCAQSSGARRSWVDAGRPSTGTLFTEKNRLCRVVRRRIRFCAARVER